MSDWVLMHLNAVRPLGPFHIGDPKAQFFISELPKVFVAAAQDPGLKFHVHGVRWPDGTYIDFDGLAALETERTEDNPTILTMAGWRDLKAMHSFTYRSDLHRNGMKTLHDWVDRSEGPTLVLWWVPRGTRVSVEDGWKKLQALRSNGPTAEAFTLQTRFDPPGP